MGPGSALAVSGAMRRPARLAGTTWFLVE